MTWPLKSLDFILKAAERWGEGRGGGADQIWAAASKVDPRKEGLTFQEEPVGHVITVRVLRVWIHYVIQDDLGILEISASSQEASPF